MTFELYRRLERIALEFSDIATNTEILFSYTGRAQKLRITLIDTTFVDIWRSLDSNEHSYHWEMRPMRDAIYRHDNAPHKKWKYISTFPKHCHDGSQNNVVESRLSDSQDEGLRQFLNIVRERLKIGSIMNP